MLNPLVFETNSLLKKELPLPTEHNFFNLNQKNFVLIPKKREFNSLQENKKIFLFKWFLKIQKFPLRSFEFSFFLV